MRIVALSQITSIPGFYEPFSSLSHLLGAVVFAGLSIPLLRRAAGDKGRVISLGIFCIGTVLLLTISGTYHLLEPDGLSRRIMRLIDHAAIFFLIACSFTPGHVILFRGWARWGMLALIWSIAVAGITLKTIYFDSISPSLGLAMYIGMGSIGLGSVYALWRRLGFDYVRPLLWGGIAYAVGGMMEVMRWPVVVSGVVQSHEVFHVAVLIGLAFHWEFNFLIANLSVDQPQPDGTP